MPRDAHIPLFLWIATAVLIHLLSGGGADKVSDWFGERLELQRFAEGVRNYVKTRNEPTIEVTFDSEEPVEPPADPSETPEDPASAPEESAEDALAERQPETAPEDRAEPEEQQPKPEVKPPEPEKKAELTEEQQKAAQELMLQKKISVRQHVENKNQADNPDAEFLGEHNNKVREQTQARITSNDENDPKPTPGANAGGIGDQPGNATETRVASNEDRPGEDARAPSDDPAKEQP
nr:hypothetical protein [Myxococcota bacterium]